MALLGFISDVHGNLDALEAVLADARLCRVDALVCLGDVVGYGPDPADCLDLVARQCDILIRGNHDEALLSQEMHREFNPRAWRSLEISLAAVSEQHLELIESMPEQAEIEGIAIRHASFSKARYEYLYDSVAAEKSFEALDASIGVVGHTHIPAVLTRRPCGRLPAVSETIRPAPFAQVVLPSEAQVILNPGSVGQPRDRNPDASWGLFETEHRVWQVRRVPYDVAAVQRRMEARGLPDYHWLRLKSGV